MGFDKPTCTHLSAHVAEACDRAGVKAHRGGTYVCMEGPQFSTLAESNTYRQLRFDVIGMTNLTEAKLAREAEICYATIAMITDYDCWHPQHDAVTVSEIIENLSGNTSNVQRVLHEAVGGTAGIARLQMRCGAGARDIDGPQNDSRGDQKAPGADHRQVHFIGFARPEFTHRGEFMSLLVVGSVAFDGIETPHGKHDRMLGGAASYFALAACHFAPVRLVGIVGDDFTAKDVALFKHQQHRSAPAGTRHGKNILLGRALQPEHERAYNSRDGA